jgi:hypothetical protein
MSLQRIFESARKFGVPVIVTDPAGRDPLVVLPLEQFEALSESGPSEAKPAVRIPVSTPRRAEVSKPSVSKEIRHVEEILAERAAEMAQPRVDEVVSALESGAAPQGAGTSEISLEERFYLEPVDDEVGG